jgi:peptidoglycan hydrolase CwlO-like protein
MWAVPWTFAADATQVTGIDPTIAFGALITGAVSVVGAVIAIMFSVSKHADERVDAASRESLAARTAENERLAQDLQDCRGETLAAEKDADLWRQKTNEREIEIATLKAKIEAQEREIRRLKRAT